MSVDRDIPDKTVTTVRFRSLPWFDAAGRFSAFKLIVMIALCVPAALVAFRYADGTLGPRAVNEALLRIGVWAIRLIFLSLAITPANRILRWPMLMQVRRMVGVAAFCYVAAHLTLYVTDEAFDFGKVASEIIFRVYLTIGFAALLILAVMAATSTDGMVRRLGGRRWRGLHRLVYAAAFLAVVHFFMQSKANVAEPLVMAGLYAWLMSYRALAVRGRLRPWLPALLGLAAGLMTAVGEALYYWIKMSVPLTRVLAVNLTLALGPRPAWIVTAICLALALAGAVRQLRGSLGRSALREA